MAKLLFKRLSPHAPPQQQDALISRKPQRESRRVWGLQWVLWPKAHHSCLSRIGRRLREVARKFFLQCIQNSLVLLRALLEDPSYSSQKQKERRKQKEAEGKKPSSRFLWCLLAWLPTPIFSKYFSQCFQHSLRNVCWFCFNPSVVYMTFVQTEK